MTLNLVDRRAVLFLPASNPRAIEKARASAADLVVLDLEDAVKVENKESARLAAVEAVAMDWPMPVAIRVNGIRTTWHEMDVAAANASNCDLVVFPLVEESLKPLDKPVAAMIETAGGVLAAAETARSCSALIVGTNDLAASLRLPIGSRASMSYALQSTLLAARAAGIAAFDGVYNRLEDPEGFVAEAEESRRLGFDGKSLIHPDQIAPCHAAFAPSQTDIERARRLVAHATGGAVRFEGAMVEDMHVEAARRLLDRYDR